ncbi:UDP-2,4-diacetamido-2,4,6-trideoxy-beta-L-altropyranose hydrolase [Schlegelella sp. S2-27]|uniref:UDP-2,4-diacetamido-2,4, 6-trideoxy-beta-L-altropyranose hydrolase n=1 Tax=Caldimonas mangrovi TaxID=2944811 RepID=A0ABT0YJV2_9BURK|nr:UDP-2,4-diacetamido-2,4,6-trideoxy-beta-L-altropyranose hydrolase [Caldimonas mangrovi]MCM5679014.1 UDP-2,4-diacetamido-2,4,6-trideoxy-beta-L-altropyranose hydrolase [Caldimonas mangrovi]
MSARKAVFRVDASLQIGTGHVMRCLTLAELLRTQGVECHFVCREHAGHLLDVVARRGHEVHRLPMAERPDSMESRQLPAHAGWLGGTWQLDAHQTGAVLAATRPQWLVVDHYALDARWESAVRSAAGRVLVVDDLADRRHDCDVLVDQTLGRQSKEYEHLVPSSCRCLTGASYALLRPEFAQLRPESLARRRGQMRLQHVVITMGGVDRDNAAGRVLQALDRCTLPEDSHITVVMGPTAPWLLRVQEQAAAMRWPTQVLVDVHDMARLMATADVAIGAAGSTSWERCCLGVPTLMLVLADNQRGVAEALEAAGAAIVLGDADAGPDRIGAALQDLTDNPRLRQMIERAGAVTDGRGAVAVSSCMLDER